MKAKLGRACVVGRGRLSLISSKGVALQNGTHVVELYKGMRCISCFSLFTLSFVSLSLLFHLFLSLSLLFYSFLSLECTSWWHFVSLQLSFSFTLTLSFLFF